MSKNAGHLVLFNAIKLLSHSAFALIRFKLIYLFQTITTCFEIICIDGLEIYKQNMYFYYKNTTFTSCQNAACSNEFIFPLKGRLCSGGKGFDWANLIFAAYFILRGRDTHTGYWFSAVFVSGRHDLPSYARAFSLTSYEMLNSSLWINKGFRLFNFSKILDLHNYKRFYFCPWMLRFPAMFCHAGPCSLAFLARCQILTDSHFQIQSFKSRRMDCSYINYGELRCDSVMISLKAMNFIINSSLFLWG